eukprot:scaffold169131_cov31-Tisochrysis_lutea.AAC.4
MSEISPFVNGLSRRINAHTTQLTATRVGKDIKAHGRMAIHRGGDFPTAFRKICSSILLPATSHWSVTAPRASSREIR